MALIDSGNTSIQMPASEFRQLKKYMMKQDPTIRSRNIEGNEILISKLSCKELAKKLDPLEFTLHHTKIKIKPLGYLYQLSDSQKDCFIGVQSIPDRFNQYRLGTIFLRNFYTGLNYHYNSLLIGLNQGTTDAEIQGAAPNPYKPKSNHGAIIFVIAFLVLMFAIAIFFYFRSQRIEHQRTIVFAGPSDMSETKKRYKNGVEIKPSEASKNKTAAINESTMESLDLSNEDKLL